jgi:hypothetical protein
MKKIALSILAFSSALLATPEVTTLTEVFSEAQTSGNVKYYFIQTDKNVAGGTDTSANANSVGGQLSFDTASLYGFSGGVTFMTTNPFLLDGPVDTSIIGKDNGVRGEDPTDSFSVLGEAYLSYKYSDFSLIYGRQVIKTPLIHAKEVRMLPSAVQGLFAYYDINKKSKVTLAYLDKFKQRTSDQFTDIIEHALGVNTYAVTGSHSGNVATLGFDYNSNSFGINAYNYYASDFMNSIYLDGTYKLKTSAMKLTLAGQYVNQFSVGNASDNLAKDGSLTDGKKLSVNAVGAKAVMAFGDSKFVLAYSKVFKDNNKHDSLVLPWDGTPLFTNMITSNDLFQSLYGKAFNADSIYIGGSQGIKIAYNQKLDALGLAGVSTSLSYLNTSNSKFLKNQNDYNAVLAYKYSKAFSFVLKGIWVQNNSSADTTGTISQLKQLNQYRVIANYKF